LAAAAAWHLRNVKDNTNILNSLFDLVCRQIIYGEIYYNETDVDVNNIMAKPTNITPIVSSKYIYKEIINKNKNNTFFVDNFNLFDDNVNSNKRKIHRTKKYNRKDKKLEENDNQFKKMKSEESDQNKTDAEQESIASSKPTSEKRH